MSRRISTDLETSELMYDTQIDPIGTESVDKVPEIAMTITTHSIRLPNDIAYTETLYTTPQQEAIKSLLEALEQDTLE